MSENKFILTLSVGPVQGFIAAARKTRDLWAGSQLLSDISKSVARALKNESDVELIFPGDDSKLNDAQFSVANVVTCTVKAEGAERLKDLARIAKEAAYAEWDRFVEATKTKIAKAGSWNEIRQEFWNAQTKAEDVIEFCAAWTPIKADEASALARAASLLAGRKNCREFKQLSYGSLDGAGVPKSSLDGARESVLKEELVKKGCDEIYLKPGEQLDAIGLVKRLGVQEATSKKECPSLLNIAIRPYLKSQKLNYDYVANFIDRADSLGELLKEACAQNDDVFNDFIKTLQGIDENGLYVAILLADGDKMGKTLADLKESDERRKFSQALSAFSTGVEERVDKHGGLCVYAGGDDVLAFLSVDQALGCADELRKWFREAMEKYEETSLSVGIVIFHYHEMLDQALDFARQAEKIAKTTSDGCKDSDERFGDRNGLAVSFYSRGNIATTIRERWSDGKNSLENPLVERLQYWALAFENDLPRGFPYDLYELIKSRVYRSEKWLNSDDLKNALQRDVMRIVQQKENVSKDADLYDVIKKCVDKIETERDLERFVNELLVAKEIGVYEALVKKERDND